MESPESPESPKVKRIVEGLVDLFRYSDLTDAQINSLGDLVHCPMFIKATGDCWDFKILTKNGFVVFGESIEVLNNGWIRVVGGGIDWSEKQDQLRTNWFTDMGRGIEMRASDICLITERES